MCRAADKIMMNGYRSEKKTDAAETPVICHAGRYNVKHIERGSQSGALFFL